MTGTLLTIGIVASILALALKPKYALVIYMAVLIWVPEYLRVSIGTIDISCGRMVGGVLLLRCLNDSGLRRKFQWSALDKAVATSMAVYVGVTLVTQPVWASVENRAGFLMDTWLAYIIARFIITDRETLIWVIKCVSIVLVPLAALGCIEATTGWQPFIELKRYRPWDPLIDEVEKQMRWGFTRAVGPFSHPILFGGTFAMFLPLIYYLRHEKSIWRNLAYILSFVAFIGALSSMSAGPWVMVAFILFCIALANFKVWAKPMLKFFIFSCIFIQILSNRPFYHVIFSYASKLGGTGWHRARLIDLAINNFGQWWIAGYGGRDPGWGYYLGISWTDMTNEYILAGVKYGLAGIIVLVWVLYAAFRGLRAAYQSANRAEIKSLYWTLGIVLISVAVIWLSISFFGQLLSLFYVVLGIIGSCSLFGINMKDKNTKAIIAKTSI